MLMNGTPQTDGTGRKCVAVMGSVTACPLAASRAAGISGSSRTASPAWRRTRQAAREYIAGPASAASGTPSWRQNRSCGPPWGQQQRRHVRQAVDRGKPQWRPGQRRDADTTAPRFDDGNILPTSDDDILAAAADADVAIIVHAREIAGVEPAFGICA